MLKQFLLKLIFVYKILLAPFLGGRCRFYPSCSEYASQALENHSSWRALLLIVRRFMRCQPLSRGGVDLVP